jgi:broad specificity phosphatase PhoE
MKMKLNVSRTVSRVVVASLLPWAFVVAAEPARTVILVRHAERAGGTDPSVGINEAGRCRARVLAGLLSDAKVRSIYTSEIARTQQTAEPLAQRLSIKPEVVRAKDIDGLVAKLRARTEEGTVLVVGHSNTIPAIVERLSGETEPTIGDGEYDRMFVVTLIGPNQASVVMLRYPGCVQ